MANKYIVKVSYIRFAFNDRVEALDFAETAFNSVTEDNRAVEVEFVREEDPVNEA